MGSSHKRKSLNGPPPAIRGRFSLEKALRWNSHISVLKTCHLLSLLLLSPMASGAILFNDTFDIPAGAATPGNDGADPNDVAWTSSGGTFLSVATRSDFTGQSLGNTGSSVQWRDNTASWGSTTLSSIGDTLTYSFRIQTNNAPALPSQQAGYGGGLFNGSGQGYFFWVGVGGNTNFSLHEDDGSVANLANDYNANGVSLLGSAGTTTSINANVTFDTTITLERVASGLSIEATFDGDTISFTDTSAPQFTFTQAMTGLGNHSVDWWTDELMVDFTPIPEPSCVMLALTPALLLLRRRR